MNRENVREIKSEIEKFVVSRDDDLIDIINKINSSDADKIILTFTDPTDILISPINLKVLLDSADEKGKALIAQVIQNPVGVRNAKEAGMTVTEATGTILDEYWNESEKGLNRRTKRRDEKLHSSNIRYKPIEEVIENKEERSIKPPSNEVFVEKEKSDFQKKIEETIERSRNSMDNKAGKVIQQDGFELVLDEDIQEARPLTQPVKKPIKTGNPSLIGRDIAFMTTLPTDEEPAEITPAQKITPVKVKGLPQNGSPILGFFKKLSTGLASSTSKKILIRVLAPLFAALVITLWLIYELTPLVKAKIYIESKPVSVEKIFNGDIKANEFNYENSIVPVKKEEASKTAAGTATPTGKAFRGNKAEGVVTLKYWGVSPEKPTVTLSAGTILTSSGGLKYEISNDVTIGEGGLFIKENVAVRAALVGEEYNLAGGNAFTVTGYNPSTELSAENTGAFTGGSKEEYTVFSQSDMDKIVKSLKTGTEKELKDELAGRTENGWEIITSTLKTAIDGNPKSDIPVGAEAEVVNVTIEMKGNAMYFKKGEIEAKMDEVLTKSAQDQNLFETEGDINLELDENIQKEITVEEVKGNSIKIKVVAKGEVKPKIDKNEIIKEIKGKNWKDGSKILKAKKYTDKATEVEFSPKYFPEFLRYFPERQGRILITVKEIFN